MLIPWRVSKTLVKPRFHNMGLQEHVDSTLGYHPRVEFVFPFTRTPTPLKINMEHNHGGLEDHFPFEMGDL